LLGKKGYVVVVVVDSCESASCFIYLLSFTAMKLAAECHLAPVITGHHRL